jgi:DUF1009 family protein
VPPKVGILAGGGDLPGRLVDACRSAGRDVFVITFDGAGEYGDLGDTPQASVRLGAVGKTLKLLHGEGCEEVILAGPIRRPDLKSLRPDLRGARLLPRILAAKGDDALLTAIVEELEGDGFRVVGADDLLPHLLAAAGELGRVTPGDDDRRDIAQGAQVLRALGPYDVGQAAIVSAGHVLGIEAAEGTEALIARIASIKPPGRAGVLVKLPKPGQDRRVDLPAIGEATVAQCAAAGLAGIAVEAGGVLVIDQDRAVAAADAAGLFLAGIVAAMP